MTNKEFFLGTEADTLAFARGFAKNLQVPQLILLRGDLGAGKTTFVRGVVQSLCGDIPVPSPTFTLMQSYESPKGLIVHLDLYRLNSPSELQELGLDEIMDTSIIFVEWPEKGNLTIAPIELSFKRDSKGLTILQNDVGKDS